MINISPLIHDHQLIAVQEPRGVLDPYEIIWHRPKTTKLGRKRLIQLKPVFNFMRTGNHFLNNIRYVDFKMSPFLKSKYTQKRCVIVNSNLTHC